MTTYAPNGKPLYGGWGTRARGVYDILERVQEELDSLRWELYGPDSYDRDYWNELDEEERAAEWARWTRVTDPEKLARLDEREDVYLEVLRLCEATVKGYSKKGRNDLP